jgi:hypothetical protein
VCTTELGLTAKLKGDFAKRGVKAIALSVDPVDSHHKWIEDINETRIAVAWSSARPAAKGYSPADPMGELQRSLLQPDVAQRRLDLLGALARQGQDTRTEVQLDAFASRAADLLLDAPVFSALGGNA